MPASYRSEPEREFIHSGPSSQTSFLSIAARLLFAFNFGYDQIPLPSFIGPSKTGLPGSIYFF